MERGTMTRARLRRHRRGVLEGLPLSVLISFFIMIVGIAILFGLFEFAKTQHLGGVDLSTTTGPIKGFVAATSFPLTVTTVSQSGGALGSVLVVVNGSGVHIQQITSANGTLRFMIDPIFYDHATSGVISVSASYSPGASFSTVPDETYVTSFEVLS